MSPSHSHGTAQNLAEFAQNLGMCTPKQENSWTLTTFTQKNINFLIMFVHIMLKLHHKDTVHAGSLFDSALVRS